MVYVWIKFRLFENILFKVFCFFVEFYNVFKVLFKLGLVLSEILNRLLVMFIKLFL